MTDVAGGGFDIGRVIERTFGVTGRNFAVFGGLALLLTGLPRIVLALAGTQVATGSDWSGGAVAMGGIGGLVTLIGAFVLQAALVHGTWRLNGASVVRAPGHGPEPFMPVMAISILATIGVFAACALVGRD